MALPRGTRLGVYEVTGQKGAGLRAGEIVLAGASAGEVYLASVKDGTVRDPVLLMKNNTAARFTAASGGRLLFVRQNNLYSQKLDLVARRLVGDSQLVTERVGSGPVLSVSLADFSVSRGEMVAWRLGVAAFAQVTTFDRQGHVVGTSGPPLPATDLRLAPDQTRLLAPPIECFVF